MAVCKKKEKLHATCYLAYAPNELLKKVEQFSE